MRSLNADGFRPSLFTLILVMGLLLSWLIWFFAAEMPILVPSQQVEIQSRNTVVAQFSAPARDDIQPGQTAFFHYNGPADDRIPAMIPALVMNVSTGSDDNRQVELYVFVDELDPPLALTTQTPGWIEIETARVSLATLVLQASGQFLNTPLVSVSP